MVERLSGVRPMVVPNGCRPVDKPTPPPADGPLLFVGHMPYPPNEDGMVSFVHDVWPTLCEAMPDLRLRIVGETTPAVEALRGTPGVEVPRRPDDLAPDWAGALALVNAVRFGSGSSRKVLDAWAAGRPVISTSAGACELRVAEGEQWLRADDAAAWVRQVRALGAPSGVSARVAGQVWARAKEHFDSHVLWQGAFDGLGLTPPATAVPRLASPPAGL